MYGGWVSQKQEREIRETHRAVSVAVWAKEKVAWTSVLQVEEGKKAGGFWADLGGGE